MGTSICCICILKSLLLVLVKDKGLLLLPYLAARMTYQLIDSHNFFKVFHAGVII